MIIDTATIILQYDGTVLLYDVTLPAGAFFDQEGNIKNLLDGDLDFEEYALADVMKQRKEDLGFEEHEANFILQCAILPIPDQTGAPVIAFDWRDY